MTGMNMKTRSDPSQAASMTEMTGEVPLVQSLDGSQLQRSWVLRFGWQLEFLPRSLLT